jgi:signal peptidase I
LTSRGPLPSVAKHTLRAAAALLAVLLLFPLVTGRPLVSFPTSSSMVPTLDPFDAFLVDPYPHDLRVGDIIVFQSVTTGGAAVHRIVGIDASGAFLTKGDANPTEDQAGLEPPVERAHVLGRVLTYADGSPVRVPKAGVPLAALRVQLAKAQQRLGGSGDGFALGLLLLAGVLAVPTFVFRDRHGEPPRRASRARQALLRRLFPRGVLGWHVGLALLALLAVSVALSLHAAHTDAKLDLVVVGEKQVADGQRAFAPGASTPRVVDVAGFALFPTVAIVEPASPHLRLDGARDMVIAPRGTATVPATQTAGERAGLQSDGVSVWRYPAFLPEAWIVALHDAMPGLPDLVLGALLALAGAAWLAASGLLSRSVGSSLGLREAWR